MLRTLFFGTSAFAVPSLRVFASRTDLFGVVTQPDRPSGRGQRLHPTPVKAAALDLWLTVTAKNARVRRRTYRRGVRPVRAWPTGASSRSLLDLPAWVRSTHPSLLPRYRGATPIQTALRRDTVTASDHADGCRHGYWRCVARTRADQATTTTACTTAWPASARRCWARPSARPRRRADGRRRPARQVSPARSRRPEGIGRRTHRRSSTDRAYAPRPAARRTPRETVNCPAPMWAHTTGNSGRTVAPNRGKMTGGRPFGRDPERRMTPAKCSRSSATSSGGPGTPERGAGSPRLPDPQGRTGTRLALATELAYGSIRCVARWIGIWHRSRAIARAPSGGHR